MSLRRPVPHALRASALAAAAVLVPVAGPTTAASGAGAFSSWSVSTGAFFQDTESASRTATAAGWVWQVSFDRIQRPVLRSRRLTDGRSAALVVALKPPPDAVDATSESLDGNGEDTQLFVAGGRAFVSGTWCLARAEDSYDCEASQAFYAQVSTRTGRVVDSSQGGARRQLVGGTRVSELVRPDGEDAYLRDLVTGRRVRSLPENARDVQGAGRVVSWKTAGTGAPSDETDGPFWRTMRVVDRVTGRRVYSLAQSTIRRAVQPRGEVLVQQALLRADGSLRLVVDVDAREPFRPVVVDRRGRVRDVTRRPMRKPTQFTSEVRAARVLLSVNTDGEGTCGSGPGWLTEVGGRRGNELRGLPRTTGFAISAVPTFETGRTISWTETHRGGADDWLDRVRVGHDVRRLALTTRGRPRC